MKTTKNYGLKKPESSDFYNVDDFNENADAIDEKLKELETPTYTEATALTALVSGEKLSVSFGKIAKAVKDFVSHITTKATTSVLGHVKVTDSSAVTDTTGLALAATEKNAAIGGTLANQISQVKSDLGKKQDASTAINTSNIGNQTVSKATYDSGGYHIHNTFNQLFNGKISTSASCNRNWNWSGQGGQPTWLWGGEDGTNMYVYNPANFSVHHANYASNGANNYFSCGYARMYHDSEGGNFRVYAPNGVSYGEFDGFNNECARMYFSSNGTSESAAVHVKAGYCEFFLNDSSKNSKYFRYNGNGIYTTTPNAANVGNSDNPWKTVYAKSGTINTSDRTKKNNINDLTIVYEQLFMKLQPKSFMFNDGDRIHIGAISQDVEDSMNELGLTPEDFAGFCKDLRYKYTEFDENGDGIEESKEIEMDDDGNPVYNYSLRYQEFIFLTIHMVQKIAKRLESIEDRLSNAGI